VLNKEFDADDDEITRTRKIRRRFVAEKYAAIVEAFYQDAADVEVTAEITFEDGRKSVMRSTLRIGDVDEPGPDTLAAAPARTAPAPMPAEAG
jgi:long-chain acyl-CoA synthetase